MVDDELDDLFLSIEAALTATPAAGKESFFPFLVAFGVHRGLWIPAARTKDDVSEKREDHALDHLRVDGPGQAGPALDQPHRAFEFLLKSLDEILGRAAHCFANLQDIHKDSLGPLFADFSARHLVTIVWIS